MTIAIGSVPDYVVWRQKLTDYYGRFATKTTLLGGSVDDTTLLQMLNDLALLTNAAFSNVSIGGRAVTGLAASPINASFKEITDLGELTFSRVNPVNAALMSTKTFLIPCIVEDVVASDKTLIVDAAGTGSLSARLGRLIGNLETYLVMRGSDGVNYTGSWTFQAGASGKVTSPGV